MLNLIGLMGILKLSLDLNINVKRLLNHNSKDVFFKGEIYMFTIEEYILNRKKKDKLNEFDFEKHSENMAKVIQYVTEYFNTYLNIEDYNFEQIKTQQ